MSNQAFLIERDDEASCQDLTLPDFWSRSSKWIIPPLWLMLFSMEDIHSLEEEYDDPDDDLSTPEAPTRNAVNVYAKVELIKERVHRRRDAVCAHLPREFHAGVDGWIKVVDRTRSSYVQLHSSAIESMSNPRESFTEALKTALETFEADDPASWYTWLGFGGIDADPSTGIAGDLPSLENGALGNFSLDGTLGNTSTGGRGVSTGELADRNQRNAAAAAAASVAANLALGRKPSSSPADRWEPDDPTLLEQPLQVLKLSPRTRNALEANGIRNLGQLIDRRATELLALPSFLPPFLAETREAVAAFGGWIRGDQ
jgi:hypothetical protein